MDKKFEKLAQPPKFHPGHHPPPMMTPRPQVVPQHPNPLPGNIPKPTAPRSSIPSGAGSSAASPGISAFDLSFAALPTFSQLQTGSSGTSPFSLTSPTHSPTVPTGRPTRDPTTRIRRERLMKRTHTLTSEQGTPIGSFEEVSPAPSPPSSPKLLAPPAVKLPQMELPPHRKDTLEKIPRRARSQSWLVRTRHLLDDDKGTGRTPWIAHCLLALSILFLVITFPFCLPFCVKVAREYERVVLFRTGRLVKGTKGPGLYFIVPCIDTYKVVDLRVLSFDVPPQEILSRDSVTVSVEAVIYFKIANPIISVTNVNDAQFSTKLLAQTTLRNVLGTKTLTEILQERDNISSVTEKVLDEGTDPWGVKVQRVEIKDIRLPQQLTKAMATEAEATRDARARIIAADGERNASKSLVDAANVIGSSRAAIHLRFLQTMSHIAMERNHTIVLPVSVEMMRGLAGKFSSFYKSTKPTKLKV